MACSLMQDTVHHVCYTAETETSHVAFHVHGWYVFSFTLNTPLVKDPAVLYGMCISNLLPETHINLDYASLN